MENNLLGILSSQKALIISSLSNSPNGMESLNCHIDINDARGLNLTILKELLTKIQHERRKSIIPLQI